MHLFVARPAHRHAVLGQAASLAGDEVMLRDKMRGHLSAAQGADGHVCSRIVFAPLQSHLWNWPAIQAEAPAGKKMISGPASGARIIGTGDIIFPPAFVSGANAADQPLRVDATPAFGNSSLRSE